MLHRTLVLVAVLALTGCGKGVHGVAAPEPRGAPAAVRVTSGAFKEGEPIPAAYTCHGEGSSPPLGWTGVPAEARALALVVDDPDAPHGTFTHWVVVDIPVSTDHVDAGKEP